jgi:nitrite reductase/ring-hydroxylating ferredoxin subunit
MAEGDAAPAADAAEAEATVGPQRLCAGEQLADRGRALVFDVLHYREPARAFALRFDGRVVAYLNRCVHVPTELDWQPGEFLDADREFIICSIHGATYEPRSGRCAAGPCGSGRLTPIDVEERDGQVFWLPRRGIRVPGTLPQA